MWFLVIVVIDLAGYVAKVNAKEVDFKLKEAFFHHVKEMKIAKPIFVNQIRKSAFQHKIVLVMDKHVLQVQLVVAAFVKVGYVCHQLCFPVENQV